MAVSATAHTTLPDAKSFLGITGAASDAILEQCIDRASAWVDRHCGRTFKASRYYSSSDWRKLYADGSVTKWLQQVTDFFVKFGNIQNAVPASSYFDTKLFLDTVKA